VADRVVLMNQGNVEQIGTPEEVYQHPATPFVYGFLGSVNLFKGRHLDEGIHVGESNLAHSGTVLNHAGPVVQGADVLAFARPHEIDIHVEAGSTVGVPARVVRVLRFGLNARVELDSVDIQPAQHFEVEISGEQALALALQEGQLVRLSAKALKVFQQPAGSQPRAVGAA
ncbi:MAG TPA: TOBE-like domain-containing protein, partial [Limnobacter sp.]|nr:TOBE-like domain-containing protein [Limnobacter sp.]